MLMPATDEIVPEPVCIGGGTGIVLTDWEEDAADLNDERRFCAEDLRRGMGGRVTSGKWDIAAKGWRGIMGFQIAEG